MPGPENFPNRLAARMELIRSAQPQTAETRSVLQQFSLEHLPLLDAYRKDTSPAMRTECLRLSTALCSRLQSSVERSPIVDGMAEALFDVEPSVRQFALLQLSNRHEEDFSPETRRRIVLSVEQIANDSALRSSYGHSPELIRLAGIARASDSEGGLKQILTRGRQTLDQPGWHESPAWAALQALARMGRAEAVDECLNRVRNHPDDHERTVMLFPQLAYITQPDVVQFFREELSKDGPAPKVEGPRDSTYADHIARMLSRMIEGFPVATQRGQSVADEARKWFDNRPEYNFCRSARRGRV